MKVILKLLTFALITGILLSFSIVAYAQTGVTGGPTFGLGTEALATSIMAGVQWTIGILMIVAVFMMIYGLYLKISAWNMERKIKNNSKINT